MTPERERITADLRGVIEGEIFVEPLWLQMYASDASIHQLKPLAVIRPRGLQDVMQVVRYAVENQISLHPRGSGSNVTGGAIGKGIVLDFSVHMRRVLETGSDTIRVQPGAVLAGISRDLAPIGRFFSPDPPSRSFSTIGGALATNGTGSCWKAYGSPREKLLEMQFVLPTGELVRLKRGQPARCDKPEVWTNIQTRVEQLLSSQRMAIQAARPDTRVNQAGYNLFDLETPLGIDLMRLIAGSEGTLGIITEATLQTDPIPVHRGVTLLFFDSAEAAFRTGVELTSDDIVACDLLDRRLWTLARENMSNADRDRFPESAEAMLLVEQQASSDGELRRLMEQLSQRSIRRRRGAIGIRSTTDAEERNYFWRFARRVIPTLFQLRGVRRAVPFMEDCAVAPARLPQLFQRIHQLLNQYEITGAVFSHVPQGVLRLYPLLDPERDEDRKMMSRFATALTDVVMELKGTVSGSFGDGLSRTWLLRRQYGGLYNSFVEVKNIFDPQHLMNPGKIVDQPQSGLTEQMRLTSPAIRIEGEDDAATKTGANDKTTNGVLPVLKSELVWQVGELAITSRNCNGCARCRTQSSLERMCPVFRIGPREEASPRAKANLMRGIVAGELPVETISSDEMRQISDLCFNCHQCRLECPATVNIPKLMVEAKAQHVAVNGLKLRDWLLSRLDLLYWLAGIMPGVTNRLIRSRAGRWLLDKTLGIAQGRKLPVFSERSFISWATRQKLNRPSRSEKRKVVFFVDAFVNWNDLELGQALVRVLQHNGIDVVVPEKQQVSGMSLISEGVLARARHLASRNVELLVDYVRRGYDVITTEPSAALALKREYLNLLDDPDAKLLSTRVHDACEYLWKLHEANLLQLNFQRIEAEVGYHLPCHQKALEIGVPGVSLLRLIPGLNVTRIEQGCSGMAGTFGLKSRNMMRSLRIGRGLMNAVRDPKVLIGSTECTTCRVQMEQGTTKPTIHPVKLLAKAYGLMPELKNLLDRKSGDLNLS